MGNVNLVTNPSFETSTTGWTFSHCAGSQDTKVTPGTGQHSCKVVADGTGAMVATITISGLTVDLPYVASFYGYISSGDFSLVPMIGDAVGPAVDTTVGEFTRTFVGFKATDTTMTFAISSTVANANGDTANFDLVSVVQTGPPMPYFDGSYPNCTWEGTAHESESVCASFDSELVGAITTDEVVVADNLCLNTMAWNITTKTGRYTFGGVRGSDIQLPGARGSTFVANKPIDDATWTLSMFLLGTLPDGSVPGLRQPQRLLFERNLTKILAEVVQTAKPVDLYVWSPDGSVRTAKASAIGSSGGGGAVDATLNMGGKLATFSIPFNILDGVWTDYLSQTTTGTPSASWSNQALELPNLAGGSVDIENAVATVTGPITNPQIIDPVTGVWVQFTGTVMAGQTWVVDSKNFTSTVGGSSVLSATTHGGYPKFLLISCGNFYTNPSVTLTGTATSAATNLSITAARQHWSA